MNMNEQSKTKDLTGTTAIVTGASRGFGRAVAAALGTSPGMSRRLVSDAIATLRLDLREVALAKGAIVPHKVDESELVARIGSDDPEEVMPPPESTKKLTPAQKDLLRRWVDEGATYQAHWAYEPIRRPAVPAVHRMSWLGNPIDAFVLASLEARGIEPSPEADRRTYHRLPVGTGV